MVSISQWNRRVIAFPADDPVNSRQWTELDPARTPGYWSDWIKCFKYEDRLIDIDAPDYTYYLPNGRSFQAYATPFEKQFSVIGGSYGRTQPIISVPQLTIFGEIKDREHLDFLGSVIPEDYNEFDIIEHMGYFSGNEIQVANSAQPKILNSILTASDEVWVDHNSPPG